VNDESGDKYHEKSEATHLQGSGNEKQDRSNELQSRHERQVAKAMLMQCVEEGIVAHNEQPKAQYRVKEHERTTYVLGSHGVSLASTGPVAA
jgi:hypothetical protein